MTLADAALFEAPFAYVERAVQPTRVNVRRDWHRTHWWLHGDARPGLRAELARIARFVVTPMVSKHRVMAWMPSIQIPENLCVAITRADDATFGILHSRIHELWSLRMGTSLEDRPRYTPTTCFETFPFPAGLAPADTAHQRTEALDEGTLIPADLTGPLRDAAARIGRAAHRLDSLRQAWLNPPEWTHRVPEVVPLGMAHSPYPDRIEARPGLSEADRKALDKRTLTNLYNQRPAWLAAAHQALDEAVAAAYALTDVDGADFWRGYSAQTPDDAILARLLALNLQRADAAKVASDAAAAVRPAKAAPKRSRTAAQAPNLE